MAFELEYYDRPDGTTPMKEFLDSLVPKLAAKVLRDLTLLEANGPSLREPHSKPLGDGVFELRSQAQGDAARSLYFFCVGRRVVVTHGFVKKTRKTPQAEIERARRYRDDWMERNANEQL